MLHQLTPRPKLIIDFLRPPDGAPLSTRDIVAAVLVPMGERKASEALLAATVRSILDYLARHGKVEKRGNA
ncbi:MAG: hypothetical protein M3O03_10530 [Pseudomonadota bacterium]|nr:hypothetical protein [Pseudomonadota bacterium]